jgi:hypothetical protein
MKTVSYNQKLGASGRHWKPPRLSFILEARVQQRLYATVPRPPFSPSKARDLALLIPPGTRGYIPRKVR